MARGDNVQVDRKRQKTGDEGSMVIDVHGHRLNPFSIITKAHMRMPGMEGKRVQYGTKTLLCGLRTTSMVFRHFDIWKLKLSMRYPVIILSYHIIRWSDF